MSSNPSLGASAGPDGDEAGTDNRRTLVAVGALAVVALGAGGYFFLGGTGAEDSSAPAAPAAAAAAAPAADAAAPVAATLPTPTDLKIGRNPFEVPETYIAPVAVAPETGTGPTTGTEPATTPGTPSGTTPGTAPGATPGTTPVTAPGTSDEKHELILLRVFGQGADQSASFSIHGTEQIAKVGSIFGPTAEILLLELTEAPAGSWTATLQVGDGDPFDVVMGEPAYVR